MRIIRRGSSGSVVSWRREQMVVLPSTQGMDAARSGGTWTEGLPWPEDDDNGYPSAGGCTADLCAVSGWGSLGFGDGEVLWEYYAGYWHDIQIPVPGDATKTAAEGAADIMSIGCGGRSARCTERTKTPRET